MLPARVKHVQAKARTLEVWQHTYKSTRLKIEHGERRRQQCDAQAGHRSLAQCLGRVTAKAAGDLHLFLHALWSGQTPGGEAAGMGETHAVMVHQVLQRTGHTASSDVSRTRHQALAACTEELAPDVA